eukprot:TRINITY_DN19781_c0_g1_i1.p1 TRINITY_DN19781_c0_g1~~TRINITY_DN19781_c0_g1_i1.p1  ORF type:complete len:140 (+),score=31.84 TRINITY_DN19781_c0_g1_i1:229-648(+)
MACGNAMRAIRTLRVSPPNDLEHRYSDSEREESNIGDGNEGMPAESEKTPDPQNSVGAKSVAEAEPEGFPSTATASTSSTNVSFAAPSMATEELLQAFPWLCADGDIDGDIDGEGADDDDAEFFAPVPRCRCEDLTKVV